METKVFSLGYVAGSLQLQRRAEHWEQGGSECMASVLHSLYAEKLTTFYQYLSKGS